MKKKELLQSILIEQIGRSGPISLGDFISLAMTHPKYGYYVKGNPLGEEGDFITAPEISQIFGELIGAWVIDLWAKMGSPDFNFIECGPGRGTLMSDILRIGSKVPGFTERVHLRFVESSSLLRKKQEKAISSYSLGGSAKWYETVLDISVDKPCIIIGNEFIDALPIEQLKRTEQGWQQRKVDVDKGGGNKLVFCEQGVEKKLLDYLPSKTSSNEIYEVSPARDRFIKECLSVIKKHGGVCLFIDYGHTSSHHGDTLQAVKSHEYSNVLDNVGQSDITSHVDFDALSRAMSDDEDIKQEPVVTQRRFLLNLGVEYRAQVLEASVDGADAASEINSAVDRLIGIDKMGELFKVFCFHSGQNIKPFGFEGDI